MIGDSGAVALSEAFTVNNTLFSLNMYCIEQSQKIHDVQRDEDYLDNQSVNKMNETGICAICKALRENKGLGTLTISREYCLE